MLTGRARICRPDPLGRSRDGAGAELAGRRDAVQPAARPHLAVRLGRAPFHRSGGDRSAGPPWTSRPGTRARSSAPSGSSASTPVTGGRPGRPGGPGSRLVRASASDETNQATRGPSGAYLLVRDDDLEDGARSCIDFGGGRLVRSSAAARSPCCRELCSPWPGPSHLRRRTRRDPAGRTSAVMSTGAARTSSWVCRPTICRARRTPVRSSSTPVSLLGAARVLGRRWLVPSSRLTTSPD